MLPCEVGQTLGPAAKELRSVCSSDEAEMFLPQATVRLCKWCPQASATRRAALGPRLQMVFLFHRSQSSRRGPTISPYQTTSSRCQLVLATSHPSLPQLGVANGSKVCTGQLVAGPGIATMRLKKVLGICISAAPHHFILTTSLSWGPWRRTWS